MKFDKTSTIIIYSRDLNSFYDIEGNLISFSLMKEIFRYGLEHPGSVTIKIHSSTLSNQVTNCNLELIDMEKGD